MKAIVQRVSEARVETGGDVVGRCGPRLTIIVRAMRGDGDTNVDALAARIAKLRSSATMPA